MAVAEITVGISTRNRSSELCRALDAVLAGNVRPSEIVVVDQSDDTQTEHVLRQRRHAGIRYVRQNRRGLSASRNEILNAATHPLVAITDDDCVPSRQWLQSVLNAFEWDPMLWGVTGRVLALGRERRGTYASSLRTGEVPRTCVGSMMPWDVGTGANFAARRERVLAIGGYDERLGAGSAGHAAEDLELYHRILKSGGTIRYMPDALVLHERHTRRQHLVTRWSYGHGIGAFCGIGWRAGDRDAPVILRTWMRSVLGRGLRGVKGGNLRAIGEGSLMLIGTLRGLAYGWAIGATQPLSSEDVGPDAGDPPPSPRHTIRHLYE